MSRMFLGGRGMHRAALLLGRLFGRESSVIVEVFDGRHIRVPLADRYWAPAVIGRQSYEPEIGYVLSEVMTEDTAFVDCGANIGWWSLFASTIIPSPERIVAMEASPSNFRRLRETAALNGNPFTSVNAAVWDRTGETLLLQFHPDLHSGSAVRAPEEVRTTGGYRMEQVGSLRLDDAIDRLVSPGWARLVVKLDVEGGEVRGLQSLGRHLPAAELVVYEDHGKLPEAVVTRAVLGAGYRVFFCDLDFRVLELHDERDAQAIKASRFVGYNFFACRPETRAEERLIELS